MLTSGFPLAEHGLAEDDKGEEQDAEDAHAAHEDGVHVEIWKAGTWREGASAPSSHNLGTPAAVPPSSTQVFVLAVEMPESHTTVCGCSSQLCFQLVQTPPQNLGYPPLTGET